MSEGDRLIAALGLRPHFEGGYYCERWRSPHETTIGDRPRALASTIYYLLTAAAPIGHFHRNRADITHFLHSGGPIHYCLIAPDGHWHDVVLGDDLGAGQALAFTCPGGWWKSSHLPAGAEHGLISEIVAPGFERAEHTMADAAMFDRLFPQHRTRWAEYVRPPGAG